MDDLKQQIEVIMQDGTVAKALEVMDKLIVSEVENTISNNDEDFDLTTAEGIADAGEIIGYYLEITTGIKPELAKVVIELNRQLSAV